MPTNPYPPVAFHFQVVFPLMDGETSFQEVSGIGSKLDTEDVVEGGENRFVHRLPKGVTHENLVLKRGIAESSSSLVEWCKKVLEGGFSEPVAPQPMNVHLLDEEGAPLRGWEFANAYPVKWEIDPFDARKNEVAIEKVELSYSYSARTL